MKFAILSALLPSIALASPIKRDLGVSIEDIGFQSLLSDVDVNWLTGVYNLFAVVDDLPDGSDSVNLAYEQLSFPVADGKLTIMDGNGGLVGYVNPDQVGGFNLQLDGSWTVHPTQDALPQIGTPGLTSAALQKRGPRVSVPRGGPRNGPPKPKTVVVQPPLQKITIPKPPVKNTPKPPVNNAPKPPANNAPKPPANNKPSPANAQKTPAPQPPTKKSVPEVIKKYKDLVNSIVIEKVGDALTNYLSALPIGGKTTSLSDASSTSSTSSASDVASSTDASTSATATAEPESAASSTVSDAAAPTPQPSKRDASVDNQLLVPIFIQGPGVTFEGFLGLDQIVYDGAAIQDIGDADIYVDIDSVVSFEQCALCLLPISSSW